MDRPWAGARVRNAIALAAVLLSQSSLPPPQPAPSPPPAAAIDAPVPEPTGPQTHRGDESLTGIWKGELGDQPVMACFDQGYGSFYRLSDKALVILWDESPLEFAEEDSQDPDSARWRMRPPDSGELAGERVHGHDRRPLRLRRVPFVERSEWRPEPCRSVAYQRSRLEPLKMAERAARVGTIRLRRTTATSRRKDEVRIETFALVGSEPGVLAVNKLLAGFIDRGPAGVSNWSQCLMGAGNLSGGFHATLNPVRIGRRYLGAAEFEDSSCGGGSPNTATYPRIFDLSRGREIRMHEWLSPRALDPSPWSESEYSEPNVIPLSPALRRELLRRLPANDYAPCDGVMESATSWSVGVGRKGFMFNPSLARVVQACGESVEIPFAAMRPFLNAQGRRAAAILASEPTVTVERPETD